MVILRENTESRYIDMSGDLDARQVETRMTVTGALTQMTLRHIPTGEEVYAETTSSRYIMQRQLMNQLKEKVNATQR